MAVTFERILCRFVRLLRTRLVLVLIFTGSLTYFLVKTGIVLVSHPCGYCPDCSEAPLKHVFQKHRRGRTGRAEDTPARQS
jgi:hypothetical protein